MKSEALEAQRNELRRDLLGLSTVQAQPSTKMETIATTVAARPVTVKLVFSWLPSPSGKVQDGRLKVASTRSRRAARPCIILNMEEPAPSCVRAG